VGLERTGGSADEVRRLKRQLRERTPLVKWLGAERPLWVARTAVQVHGGYGVVQEYDVERHYRDALILPIYEGTSQIQALMSLKDQVKQTVGKPWRLAGGPVRVLAPPNPLGDALREMAGEYNRAFRVVLAESIGFSGMLRGLIDRTSEPDPERLGYALLHAERLAAMMAYTRAAEALTSHAARSPRHRSLAERFVHRSLPLVRMYGEIVRSRDKSTLERLRT
jgi:hypothetical protein